MSTNKCDHLLLLNYMKTGAHDLERAWEALRVPRPSDACLMRSVFKHESGDRLLECVVLSELAGLSQLFSDPGWKRAEMSIRPCLRADFRRQLHAVADVVKGAHLSATNAPHLQLVRYEVRPDLREQHASWRTQILNPHLGNHPDLDALAVYDSLISTEPSILQLSLLSGSVTAYKANLDTSESTALNQQLIERYIVGGAAGLYASVWTRLALQA